MRLTAAVIALVVVAGCAAPPVGTELVVVLPDPAGHVGSVAVQSGGTRQVLDRPYAGQRVKADRSVEPAQLTAAEVRQSFAAAMDALPGRPATFTLYFLEGKDELTADSRAELEKVFAELKNRPLPDIVLIGHTDTVGGLAFNDKLSLARAERLRTMLMDLGIARESMETAGRGKRELLVPTEDNTPEPRNRRVEISVR